MSFTQDLDHDDESASEVEVAMQKKFSSNACGVLSDLRESGELCDAVIKVDERTFPIHRAIMSACSPYFRALFTNQRFSTNRQEVSIPGVSPDSMNAIIEYAYKRDVNVNMANVEQLLPAADQFHVMGIVRLCCDFLQREICPENVIGIRAFARTFFCQNLERQAFRYLLRHIADVYKTSNEFLQLDIDEVSAILGSDDLNVKNEEIVFDAVLRWIDFDQSKRKCNIVRLLRTIRLGLLTAQYFAEKVGT